MNYRDVELLSAYLDGQTSPSDSTRLEARLKTDPELAAALQSLRESRGLLRQLPKRRAPRNFTLTPAMVGKKPPLPRSYPVFRFATALAALLLVFSFAANRAMQYTAAAPAPAAYGIGGGGGGGNGNITEAPSIQMVPAATEPAVAEPTYSVESLTTPTPEPATDQNRVAQPPVGAAPKTGSQPISRPETFHIPSIWQIVFGVIALLGAGSMFLIQRLAANKWRGK